MKSIILITIIFTLISCEQGGAETAQEISDNSPNASVTVGENSSEFINYLNGKSYLKTECSAYGDYSKGQSISVSRDSSGEITRITITDHYTVVENCHQPVSEFFRIMHEYSLNETSDGIVFVSSSYVPMLEHESETITECGDVRVDIGNTQDITETCAEYSNFEKELDIIIENDTLRINGVEFTE